MLEKIIKRDGSIEDFIPSKLNRWAQWATEKLENRVDWSTVVFEATKSSGKRINSQDLQRLLIKVCIEKKEWSYNLMAGRLHAALLHKQFYSDEMPPVKDLQAKLVNLGLMSDLGYTDEEYAEIENIIDHSRDFNLAHFQLEQIKNKYSIQNRQAKSQYETPQYTYMRMAMALSKDEDKSTKLMHVKNFYNHFSFGRLSAPSPNYINLGTPHNGYASCCLIVADDDANSLAIGDHIAYVMTCMSAGIGSLIMSRSVKDPVRNGLIEHQGKKPYFKALAGAVNANTQTGRGGACTAYYTVFDPEAQEIALLQNPRTVESKKNRDIHFAVLFNRFFATKVLQDKDIFTFNKFTAPDLSAAFFSGDQEKFEKIYNEYEQKDSFVKNYVSSRKLFLILSQQTHEVGTHYFAFIDEINRNTPYKETIHSSNLCVAEDTQVITKDGEVAINTLAGQDIELWNGKEWALSRVEKTGENKKLIRVILSRGLVLFTTPEHKWFIIDDDTDEVSIKQTSELKHGDKIEPFKLIDAGGTITSSNDIRVCSVSDTNAQGDTYCVNEPTDNSCVFNKVRTHNCLEITSPTKPYYSMEDLYSTEEHDRGEVALCSIAGIAVPNIKSDEEYASVAYYALKMIKRCIHLSEYPLKNVGVTAKRRLNAAVGVLGLATTLARDKLKYTSREGKRKIHKVFERHAYFLIEAALKIGEQEGNAPWIDKTKWPQGWLPIDNYKPAIDEITDGSLVYDWEGLRSRIIKNKGIGFSSVIAHMPTESSSKAIGLPNGVYPIRDLFLKKTDNSNVLDWCPVDNDILKEYYQIAWDIPAEDMIEVYALIQKFTDQSTSADLYKDRIASPNLSTTQMLKEFFLLVKYGVKTTYYQNSLTSKNVDEPAEQDPRGCESGACTL